MCLIMELFLKNKISKRQISSKMWNSQMNRSDLETQICQRYCEKQKEFYFQAHTVEVKKLIIILRLLFSFLSAIRNVSQSTKWEASMGDDSTQTYTLNLQTSGFYLDNINILQSIYFWIMPFLTLWFNTKPKLYCPHRILQGSPVSFRNAEEKHWLKVLCSLQNSFKVLSSIEISKTNCFLFVKRKRKKCSTSDSNS